MEKILFWCRINSTHAEVSRRSAGRVRLGGFRLLEGLDSERLPEKYPKTTSRPKQKKYNNKKTPIFFSSTSDFSL